MPNSEDWQILPELTRLPVDITLTKTANDSFYKNSLQSVLSRNKISELLVTGCATYFCVDTTVKAALNLDYKVTVVEDAHTTASLPFVDAETVIKYYNWLWSNMSATKYKLAVTKTINIKL